MVLWVISWEGFEIICVKKFILDLYIKICIKKDDLLSWYDLY